MQITRDTVKRGFKDGAGPETRTGRDISGPIHIHLAGPVYPRSLALSPIGSSPCAKLFADMLASIRCYDDPRHNVRNRHDLKLSTMAIRLSLEFFHHLHQPLVVTRNRYPAPVEA